MFNLQETKIYHVVYAFRSIFTCFNKFVSGIIVNLHNIQYDDIYNFNTS